MTCPKCGFKTAVVDTANLDVIIYRKRKCCKCNNIFYSIEQDTNKDEAEREIKNYRNERKKQRRKERIEKIESWLKSN